MRAVEYMAAAVILITALLCAVRATQHRPDQVVWVAAAVAR